MDVEKCTCPKFLRKISTLFSFKLLLFFGVGERRVGVTATRHLSKNFSIFAMAKKFDIFTVENGKNGENRKVVNRHSYHFRHDGGNGEKW